MIRVVEVIRVDEVVRVVEVIRVLSNKLFHKEPLKVLAP